jgi:tRNA pseudouridine38-40 synthase
MSLPENVKLTIAYDGTCYGGWQENPQAHTVEGELRKALERIQQHSIILQAASRTDAGVHADAQIVNFTTPQLRKDPGTLVLSLNALMPQDIRVLEAKLMPLDFHPTLDVVGKEYHYWINHGRIQYPKDRWTVWHHPYPALNYTAIREATCLLIGTHDFAAFCRPTKLEQYKNTIRTIEAIDIESHPTQHLLIKVRGNHFLYKMVRTIVGTLIAVGRGELSLENLCLLLQQKKRAAAGMTAPAHGLTLYRVFYPETSAAQRNP